MAEKNNRPVSLDKMRQNSIKRQRSSRQTTSAQPPVPPQAAPINKPEPRNAHKTPRPVKKKGKRKNTGLIYQWPVQIVLALIVIIGIIIIIPFHNAYKVVYGEEVIAYIQKEKDYTEEDFNTAVNDYLQTAEGAPVVLSNSFTLVSARAGNDDIKTIDNLMPLIKETITYQIKAVRITVNGSQIAVIANEKAWTEIKEELISPYLNVSEGAELVEADFEEVYSVDTDYQTDPDTVMNKEEALEKFKQTREIDGTYTVVAGDSFDKIAPKVGMTRDQLQYANPDVSSSELKIGQVLNIKTQKPLLSVRVVEKTTQQQTLDKEIQYQDDPTISQGTNSIIQAGTSAIEEVITYTTKINGVVQTDLTTTDRNLIEAGTPEIVKRGTGQ